MIGLGGVRDAAARARLDSVERGGRTAVTMEAPLNARWPEYGLVLGSAKAGLNAAFAAGAGREVFLPNGEYVIDGPMLPPSNIKIRGESREGVVIKVANGSALGGGVLQWTNGVGVRVEDLTIDLNKAGTPDGGADGAQMGVYFYTAPGGATRGCVLERVKVKNGQRHNISCVAAAAGLPLEVDLIGCDSEDADRLGLFASRVTKMRVVRGNYLRSGLDNIQFDRSAGFVVDGVVADNAVAGHGVVAGDMCTDFAFLGGSASGNAFTGWVVSVRGTRFRLVGLRARGNGEMGITVDVRNHSPILTAAITNVATTVPVDSTTDHLASGTISIGTEHISYTGITATSFTGCTRGVNGTTAAAHLINAIADSEVVFPTDGVVVGYDLSLNSIHGLYYQYGHGLAIGAGTSYDNVQNGVMLVAQSAALSGGIAARGNARGLVFENSSTGLSMGGHKVGGGNQLRANTVANFVNNASIGSAPEDALAEWTQHINPTMTPATQTTWSTVSPAAIIGGGSKLSSGAQNAEIGWDVELSEGTWTIELMHASGTNIGIYTVSLDGTSVGTIDGYSAGANNQLNSIAGIVVTGTRKRRLLLKMATKNASATGFFGNIQLVALRRTA